MTDDILLAEAEARAEAAAVLMRTAISQRDAAISRLAEAEALLHRATPYIAEIWSLRGDIDAFLAGGDPDA